MSMLQVSPATLRARASELEAQRQRQMEVMKNLRVLVFGLNESWKGESQTAFVNRFIDGQQKINALSQTLADFVNLAQQAASEAESGDAELLSLVNNI